MFVGYALSMTSPVSNGASRNRNRGRDRDRGRTNTSQGKVRELANFAHAVQTARAGIPVQQQVVKAEFWSEYTIGVTPSGDFRVYQASAWERPTVTPMLPWRAPTGTPVATVRLDGTVHMLPI